MDKSSSHLGHVAFVVLALLIGSVIGYTVGYSYEGQILAEDTASNTNTVVVHKTTSGTLSAGIPVTASTSSTTGTTVPITTSP